MRVKYLGLSGVVPKGPQQLGNLFGAKEAGAFLRRWNGLQICYFKNLQFNKIAILVVLRYS